MDKSLFLKLCDVVNLRQDTDTNAALVGGLLGLTQEIAPVEIIKLRNIKLINDIIEKFADCFIDR